MIPVTTFVGTPALARGLVILLSTLLFAGCGDDAVTPFPAGGGAGGGGGGEDPGGGGGGPGGGGGETGTTDPVTTPQAGQNYAAGTRVGDAESGVSFIVADGWSAALSQDGAMLQLTVPGNDDVLSLALVGEISMAQAQQTLGNPIDLGDGFSLQPSGSPRTDGSQVEADYSVSGTQNPLLGFVQVTVGSHGQGLTMVGLATEAQLDRVRSDIRTMGASARFDEPGATTGGGGTGDATFEADFVGTRHTRFVDESGYNEEEIITLCAGHRMTYNWTSSSSGGGTTLAYFRRGSGTWYAAGSGLTGTLVITFEQGESYMSGGTTDIAGEVYTYAVRWEGSDDSWELYLDDSRFYRESASCD